MMADEMPEKINFKDFHSLRKTIDLMIFAYNVLRVVLKSKASVRAIHGN